MSMTRRQGSTHLEAEACRRLLSADRPFSFATVGKQSSSRTDEPLTAIRHCLSIPSFAILIKRLIRSVRSPKNSSFSCTINPVIFSQRCSIAKSQWAGMRSSLSLGRQEKRWHYPWVRWSRRHVVDRRVKIRVHGDMKVVITANHANLGNSTFSHLCEVRRCRPGMRQRHNSN